MPTATDDLNLTIQAGATTTVTFSMYGDDGTTQWAVAAGDDVQFKIWDTDYSDLELDVTSTATANGSVISITENGVTGVTAAVATLVLAQDDVDALTSGRRYNCELGYIDDSIVAPADQYSVVAEGYIYIQSTATAATTSLAVTFGDLRDRIAYALYGIRDHTDASTTQLTDINYCLEDGMRRVYVSHDWSFYRPVKTITTVADTYAYDLPSGYESIETKMSYAPGESDFYPPVEQRSDRYIRKRQQDDDETGRPLYFSVRTKEYDLTLGSQRQLILYPTPDDAYVLYARMILRPVASDTTGVYPVGAEIMSQLFIEACLAAVERNYDEVKDGEHEDLFRQMLAAAIARDVEATAPTTLGPDAPKGENRLEEARSLLIGTVTYNGTTM